MPEAGKHKLILQSGVIPYRWRDGRLEVLLITSMRSGDWIVPKGLIEPDMTAHDSAAKEGRGGRRRRTGRYHRGRLV